MVFWGAKPQKPASSLVAATKHSNGWRGKAPATREFLADQWWNQVTSKSVEVSNIFKWYGSDCGDSKSLRSFLAAGLDLPEPVRSDFLSEKIRLKFAPYDWSLNDAR